MWVRVVRFGGWVVVVLALMLVGFGFGVAGALCGLYNMVCALCGFPGG